MSCGRRNTSIVIFMKLKVIQGILLLVLIAVDVRVSKTWVSFFLLVCV